MPLPNTSPDMSPMPATVKSVRLRVDAHLAEMPLDRLPRSARRDAHHLVVVPGGAAGGKGVVEPEAILGADRIRKVGECRRALVRGDDQIRIVRVVTLDLGRGHDLVDEEVVGEIQQPAQVVLVAGDALLHEGFAVRRRRCALEHESALGAHRNDHDVLDHLRLDQAEHLRAEVLRPVGPAQSTARDLAATQVHTLEPRRVDEDLEHRLGLG